MHMARINEQKFEECTPVVLRSPRNLLFNSEGQRGPGLERWNGTGECIDVPRIDGVDPRGWKHGEKSGGDG